MPRKIQPTYTKSQRGKTLLGVGDSLTQNNTYGLTTVQYWPERLAVALRALKCGVGGYNMGSSGRTSGQMLENIGYAFLQGIPTVTGIYAGTNDPQYATTVQASPAPTATTFTVGAGRGANYRPGTWVLIGSNSARILSVAGDAITLTAPLSGGAPAAGTAVTIDTTTNIVQIANYLKGFGCTRFLVFGQHYYNYASAGDTTSTQLAANATLRTQQQAAVTAINALGGVTAAYVDLYAYMRGLIVNGTPVNGTVFTQGDNGWHVAASNLHLNVLGEQILADAALTTIQGQPGWLSALA